MQPKAFQTLKSFFISEDGRSDVSLMSRTSSFNLGVISGPVSPVPGGVSVTNMNMFYAGDHLISTLDYDEDALDSVINDQTLSRSSTYVTRSATPVEM